MAGTKTKAPIVILHVTHQPYLSIARFYGRIKAYDTEYFYHPIKDALIRKDYMKQLKKHKDWDKFLDMVKAVNDN